MLSEQVLLNLWGRLVLSLIIIYLGYSHYHSDYWLGIVHFHSESFFAVTFAFFVEVLIYLSRNLLTQIYVPSFQSSWALFYKSHSFLPPNSDSASICSNVTGFYIVQYRSNVTHPSHLIHILPIVPVWIPTAHSAEFKLNTPTQAASMFPLLSNITHNHVHMILKE